MYYIEQFGVAAMADIPESMHTTNVKKNLLKVWPNAHSAVNSEYKVAYLSEAINSSLTSKDAVAT